MPKSLNLTSAKRLADEMLYRYSPRGLLLYILSLALIPAVILDLIKGQAVSVLVNASAFTFYCLAAVMLRRGLMADNPPPGQRWAKQPKWPLKRLSALLVAVTTGLLAALGAGQSWPVAALYAAGAFLGMYLSYGFGHPKNQPTRVAPGYSDAEIGTILADAYALIQGIEQANRKIDQAELNRRIDGICEIAASIIGDLETDPRGIPRARKFLHVYLENVQQVVQGYAKTHQQSGSLALESNFRQALEAIESAFQEQQQRLLEEDVFDLDVKIEVLTQQLKHEGIL